MSAADGKEVTVAQLKEEVEYYRQYAARCEAELKAAQSRLGVASATDPDALRESGAGGSSGGGSAGGGVDAMPPWVATSRYMNPLLLAYDTRIRELTAKNIEHVTELGRLRSEMDQFAARNSQLEKELEQSIGKLLRGYEQASAGAGTSAAAGSGGAKAAIAIVPAGMSEDELHELRQRVALYMEELDIVRTTDAELRDELVRTKQQLAEAVAHRNTFAQNNAALAQAQRVADAKLQQFERVIRDLEQQYDAMANECKLAASERIAAVEQLKSVSAQLAAAKDGSSSDQHAFQQTTQKMQIESTELRRHLASLTAREHELSAKVQTLTAQLNTEAEGKKQAQARAADAAAEADQLVRALESLQRSVGTYKARETELVTHANAQAEAVANAELAREQAVQREQTAKDINAKLSDRLRLEVEATKKQGEEQVARAYQHCKDRELKLMDELKRLELLCHELEQQRLRADRDKASAQSQFQKLSSAVRNEAGELRTELANAQAAVMEMRTQKDTAHTLWQNAKRERAIAEQTWQKEREMMNALVGDAKQRAVARELELKELQQQRVLSADLHVKECAELELSIEHAAVTERKLNAQIAALEQSRAKEIDELNARLKHAYKLHEESEARAGELLAAQDALGQRWRQENANNIVHFQRLVREARAEAARVATRNAQLDAAIAKCEQQKQAAVQHAHDTAAAHDQLNAQMAAREKQLSDAIAQMQHFAQQIPMLTSTIRELETNYEKLAVEKRRIQREMTFAQRRALMSSAAGAASVSSSALLHAMGVGSPLASAASASGAAQAAAALLAAAGSASGRGSGGVAPHASPPALMTYRAGSGGGGDGSGAVSPAVLSPTAKTGTVLLQPTAATATASTATAAATAAAAGASTSAFTAAAATPATVSTGFGAGSGAGSAFALSTGQKLLPPSVSGPQQPQR